MFPMITCVNEFIEAKKIYLEAYEQVKLENSRIANVNEIEVGLMMETPSCICVIWSILQVCRLCVYRNKWFNSIFNGCW
nr:putative PEP-binding protein [Mycoplasmopsis bovis]